ncbi:peptidase family protein [Marinitoga piezophila KA3]|uniref:Peptidase family protein n=1 Tax=Marinitoga piezophila (strain DSM 14283 / JCM 11233 / KA3) TaxID=443254 RepID=H2J685_MARPK|nr:MULTISPECIES: M42 family metallopeptidase [Marinitoga]AEX86233.1 peptidase family protein [Marinitoga piezophila KA3]APT76644.1 aminopeptidase [Marinitoga sp. 1137]
MKELIKKLTEITSPSGREDKIREAIIEEIKDYVDEIDVDKLGNLIAIKKGTGDKTILFDAHMDEIGLVVTHITDDGFLRIEPVGGVNPRVLIGAMVQFNGYVGVVGFEGETVEEYSKNQTNLTFDVLYVDLGFKSREEAEEKTPIGTFGTYYAHFNDLGDKVVSKSLDDRIGCVALIETIKKLDKPENNVIFVFSVQEEVGLIGASVAGFNYDVDMAIAVDVTASSDTPKYFKRISMKLDEGPTIKVKDSATVSDRVVVEHLKKIAKKENIKHQMEVLIFGGTNAAGYQLTKSGIPSGTISIPTRYIHTPHEMVSMFDVEETVKFLVALANNSL